MDQPANTFTLITNEPALGQTWIALPNAGVVWIALEWQEPPVLAQIWHEGGTTTPITEGPATYEVSAGDAIVYMLSAPTDSIKIGWAYVS